MNMIAAVKTCLSKYTDFSGRARRAEYWWFALFLILVNGLACLMDLGLMFLGVPFPLLSILVGLGLFLPKLAVSSRRLHDTNESALFMFMPLASVLLLVPVLFFGIESAFSKAFIGFTVVIYLALVGVLIVQYCQKGNVGPNRFGEDPLAGEDDYVSAQ